MKNDVARIRTNPVETGAYTGARIYKRKRAGSSGGTNGGVGITLCTYRIKIEDGKTKGEEESDESKFNVFHNRCIQSV